MSKTMLPPWLLARPLLWGNCTPQQAEILAAYCEKKGVSIEAWINKATAERIGRLSPEQRQEIGFSRRKKFPRRTTLSLIIAGSLIGFLVFSDSDGDGIPDLIEVLTGTLTVE